MKRFGTLMMAMMTIGPTFPASAERVIVGLSADGKASLTSIDELKEKPGDLVTLWTWTEDSPPKRITGEFDLSKFSTAEASRRLIVVVPKPEAVEARSLTLVAGPVAMWLEVPESLLPSWPIEEGSKVALPTDGTPWRVRIHGKESGSFWIDVPAGGTGTSVAAGPAKPAQIRIIDENGDPIPHARTSLGQRDPIEGGYRKLAEYRSDESGHVEIPAIPPVREPFLLVVSVPDQMPFAKEVRRNEFPSTITVSAGISLEGTLLSTEGKPVENAAVLARAWMAPDVPIALVRQTTSDEAGKWHLKGITPGAVEWSVTAEGFVPRSRSLHLEKGTRSIGTVTLNPGVGIALEVVDDEHLPIEHALVAAGGNPMSRTDQEGNASLTLDPDKVTTLIVSADNHQPATVSADGAAREIRAVLLRNFVVTGQFVSHDFQPVRQGEVRAYRGSSFTRHPISGESFRLSLRPDQEYLLEFRSGRTAATSISIKPGAPGELRDLGKIIAEKGIVVVGRIVNQDSGAPVIGAEIHAPMQTEGGNLVAWAFGDLRETSSSEDGQFELEGLGLGETVVSIDAPGLASRRIPIRPQLGSSQIDLGTIAMERGSVVIVKLRGDPGSQARARLDLVGSGVPTDLLEGTFVGQQATIHNVPTGTFDVSVWRDETLLCETRAEVPEFGEVPLSICTVQQVSVEGSVTMGGHPHGPGFLLWMSPAVEGAGSVIFNFGRGNLRQQKVHSGAHEQLQAVVGYDGYFKAELPRPGEWEVYFIPDNGTALGPSKVSIPTADRSFVTIAYPGGMVAGTVTDSKGAPVHRADVRELGGHAIALTREDGTFTLGGLAAGTSRIQARAKGRTSEVKTILIDPEKPTVLTLVIENEPGIVQVLVSGRQGAARGAVVVFETDSGLMLPSVTNSNGIAAIKLAYPFPEWIRAGAITASGIILGDWTGAKELDATLVLNEELTGALSVVAEKLAGPVVIERERDGWRIDRLLQWGGVFPRISPATALSISGLPAGRYAIRGEDFVRSFEIKSGETSTLELP